MFTWGQWHCKWQHCICYIMKIQITCNMFFFHHVMPLTPESVSYNANSIINGTTEFVMSTWSQWRATSLFDHVMPLVWDLPSYNTNSIINGTTAFDRSRQSKLQHNFQSCYCWHRHQCPIMPMTSTIVPFISFGWDDQTRCDMTFWLYYTIDTGIKWCQWNCKCHHCIC